MNKITDSVHYAGVLNPNLRVFDVIMNTAFGTTYNSYVVRGEAKTALVEAVHFDFFDDYLEKITAILGDSNIDYLVLNHCEPDHSGCVKKLLEVYPNLTVVVSVAGAIYIKNIVNDPDMNIMVVNDEQVLDLGGVSLHFINAPFLHWPDSMFTWLPQQKVLFSCDFLGSHFCETRIIDKNIKKIKNYWLEMENYYKCIFGPFPSYVQKGLKKIEDLDIEFVCCSHGPVLTKDGVLAEVIKNYNVWSLPKVNVNMKIPVFYCSAYGNTRKLACSIANGVSKVFNTADVDLYDVIEHNAGGDYNFLAEKLNLSDAFLIGSPTLNRAVLPPIVQLLACIDTINIAKKHVALFGSFGWSGEALPQLIGYLTTLKASVFEKQFRVNFVPSHEELAAAEQFGVEFAQRI